MSYTKLDWLAVPPQPGFGVAGPDADFLHLDTPATSFNVAETYWLQFSLPEHGIDAEFYLWVHPGLGMASGGVWIWRGFKRAAILAECLDYKNYLPLPRTDGASILLPEAGLRIDVLEPLRRIRFRYEGATGGTLDVIADGLMPPIMRADNHHFEQPMKVHGALHLDGREYAVDTFGFRDRSWGQPRSEDPLLHPPMGWTGVVFGRGETCLNFVAIDDPAHNPEWAGVYDIGPSQVLKAGWIWRNGQLKRLRSVSKKSVRAPEEMMRPVSIHCEMEDEDGGRHTARASAIANLMFPAWPNSFVNFALMRWELDDGTVGYGDIQDFYWTDYARRFCR